MSKYESVTPNICDSTSITDLDIYRVLIEENKHMHTVWIDNYRVVITFNSILMVGAFTLLTIVIKSEIDYSTTLILPWALRFLAMIGILITLVGVQIIRRTKAITTLRLKELQYIENLYSTNSKIKPFNSGLVVLGKNKSTFYGSERYPICLKRLRCNFMSGFVGYMLISTAFLISFILIFICSFMDLLNVSH